MIVIKNKEYYIYNVEKIIIFFFKDRSKKYIYKKFLLKDFIVYF